MSLIIKIISLYKYKIINYAFYNSRSVKILNEYFSSKKYIKKQESLFSQRFLFFILFPIFSNMERDRMTIRDGHYHDTFHNVNGRGIYQMFLAAHNHWLPQNHVQLQASQYLQLLNDLHNHLSEHNNDKYYDDHEFLSANHHIDSSLLIQLRHML